MFMSGIEKNGFDKGKEIGLKEGEKKMFDIAVQNFMKRGKSKEQAIKEALEFFSLEEIPE